jgi:hypothetical protein
MKPVFKILKISAAVLFLAIVILIAAAQIMQDKVAGIVLSSLNRTISTKLHYGTVRFSFLSHFPHASLELQDVLVSSSPTFNKASFAKINTDTLLSARAVAVEFRITDVFTGNYNADRISARHGYLNIFTDSAGMVNYNITTGTVGASGSPALNLERIGITDIQTFYNDLSSRVIIKASIHDGSFKSRIKGEDITFAGTADILLKGLQVNSINIARKVLAKTDIDIVKSLGGINIRKGSFRVDNSELDVAGSISASDIYDLRVSGKNIHLSRMKNYLHDSYYAAVAEYEADGILNVDGKIKGMMTRNINPHTEIGFRLEKGKFTRGRSKLSADHISFDGNFSNGPRNKPATCSVRIRNISAKAGSSQFKGSFALSDFDNPYAEISVKGRIIPSEIIDLFEITGIKEVSGTADADLKFSGRTDLAKKLSFSTFARMKTEGQLGFRSFSLTLKNGFTLKNINGDLKFTDAIRADKLSLTYKGHRFAVDGEFKNLLRWLDKEPVKLVVKADVSLDRLIPGAFQENSAAASSARTRAFRLPPDVYLDLNFRIDSLRYKTFTSSNISGSLNYKPKILTFKSFNVKALNGTISGNGFIVQNPNGSVLSKGIFRVAEVDVNKAFISFQNFGQSFLKAENIAGSLSGSFSLLLPLDSMGRPLVKSLVAEGKYTLVNGALLNFDPMKRLSAFAELSELQNIHFEKLENDFFIRNNYLYIPTMEVRSSVADLSVNGKQSFDTDYEYHVKILLSELLSKKIKPGKKTNNEFGDIQDDGLGRTSMLLRISYKGKDVKVGYDMKAAAVEVKKNFDSEKKNLKSILNEEYGWYGNDSTAVQKPGTKEKKARFKVTWDDK